MCYYLFTSDSSMPGKVCGTAGVVPSVIDLYRENAIEIESEARDPNGGNVYYITMQITFHIQESAREERNLHCDVVSRLVLDHAIAAIHTSRRPVPLANVLEYIEALSGAT